MISGLLLRNFQSHKKSILHFHPGVNAIIGKSNSGKTAILRALYWIIYNRPSGISFISFWNRDKKGNPLEPTLAQIINNNKKITRVKSKEAEESGYKIADEMLSAVGVSVPSEVTEILNMGEVNIQRQMDAPFLLSESAEDVARFFNNIIRLDIIDEVLSKAESERRSLQKDIKQLNSSIISLENDSKEYLWIVSATGYIEKYEEINKRILKKKERKQSIEILVFKIEKAINQKKEFEDILEAVSDKMMLLEKITTSISEKKNIISSINKNITRCEKYDPLMKIDFKLVYLMIEEFEDRNKELDKKNLTLKTIRNLIYTADKKDDIKKYDEDILKLTNKLPPECPSCGGKIDKEGHSCV